MSHPPLKPLRYAEAISLLSRACFSQYPDANSHDVADALGHAIGRALPREYNAISCAVDIIETSNWPDSQDAADIFLGRYLREYRLLASSARGKGLKGLDPNPREIIDSHFRARPDDDHLEFADKREIQAIMARREICIEMLDLADDERSPIFESTRMVLRSGRRQNITDYISAWIAYMVENDHDDIIIAQRLKKALNAPRLAVLSSTNH